MRLIFCGHPLDMRLPDPDYEPEVAAARSLGMEFSLLDLDALVLGQNAERAVRRVAPAPDVETAVYRGWMVTPSQYGQLHEALLDRRVRLINTPEQYEHCHHLPRWYPSLAGETPRSVWARADDGLSTPRLMELLRSFGDDPIIVKDFVKSRKHEWHEACFIPSASDAQSVDRVVGRFLELQGDELREGLVFREFVEFEPLATHSKSGMPLTREFRLFFLDGGLVEVTRYWDEGDYRGSTPPLAQFEEIARKVQSRFFTMDVAPKVGGGWSVVELGDAQVAELPDPQNTTTFLKTIRDHVH